jgi:hypothetical protein
MLRSNDNGEKEHGCCQKLIVYQSLELEVETGRDSKKRHKIDQYLAGSFKITSHGFALSKRLTYSKNQIATKRNQLEFKVRIGRL